MAKANNAALAATAEVVATAEAVVVVTEEAAVAAAATAGAVAVAAREVAAIAEAVAAVEDANKTIDFNFSKRNTCYSLRDQNTGKRRKAGFARWPSVVLPLLSVHLR